MIDICRRENKKKILFYKYEKNDYYYDEATIIIFKTKIEEDKRIDEIFISMKQGNKFWEGISRGGFLENVSTERKCPIESKFKVYKRDLNSW